MDQLIELTAGPPTLEGQGEYVTHKALGLAINFLQRELPASSSYYYGYNSYYEESTETEQPEVLAVAAKHNDHS